MKSSTLALQIALFASPGANATFVPNKRHAAMARPKRPLRRPEHRRYRKDLSTLIEVKSSVASPESSSSSAELIELLPVIRHRHPLFSETNAVSKPMPVPHPDLWRKSLPTKSEREASDSKGKENTPFWNSFLLPQSKSDKHQEGKVLLHDRHVQFDSPAIGARLLLEQCGVIHSSTPYENDENGSPSLLPPETIMYEEESVKHLTAILSHFQTVAAPLNGPKKNVKCIARVVSTVGSAGIKCPRWHADHVPVRLVMSILGPGCQYIPEDVSDEDRQEIVNHKALNNLDVDDTMEANDIIVPPRLLEDAESRLGKGKSPIKHAEEGEAVLLMGRGWEDTTPISLQGENLDTTYSVQAAVHRSPILSPDQERILLTVDLVDWD